MDYPTFYDQAPRITVRDPLADFLGAFEEGIITYRYIDAVRLAGHSCPTVAGAWLMTRRALQLLYPEGVAERGAIQVQFAQSIDEGAVGVTAGIVGLVTGAAGPGGFKGIGSRFRRQNLMYFGRPLDGEIRFERTDNGDCISIQLQMHHVPADPRTMPLLKQILGGRASPEEASLFSSLWQDRVRRLLIEHADDPELVVARHAMAA